MCHWNPFDYSADWRGATKSVADFAKELLYGMRFSIDGDRVGLNTVENPVIFVVHSASNLVIKKASNLLGLHDENYRSPVLSEPYPPGLSCSCQPPIAVLIYLPSDHPQ